MDLIPQLVGHIAAWNYFMSAESGLMTFIEDWLKFIKDEKKSLTIQWKLT